MNLNSRIILNLRTISQIFSEIKKGMLISFVGLLILFLLLAYREYTQWDYFKNVLKLSEEEIEKTGQLIKNLGYMSIGSLLIVALGCFSIFSNLSKFIDHIDFDGMIEDNSEI